VNRSGWRKRYRVQVQAAALALGVLSPFALYWALGNGQIGLAGASFGLLVLGMLLAFLVG